MTDLPPSCPICDQQSSRQSEVGGFEYFRCSSCDHVFLERRHEASFGKDFYESRVYKDLEAQWPKAERLLLFDRIVAQVDIALGRQARSVLDYGAGSEDIDEKRRRAPHVTFYDPNYGDREGVAVSAPDREFDAVICTEVMEHVFDPISILRDIRRHSRVCLLTTMLHDWNFNLSYFNPMAGHVALFSRKSIALAARKAGWRHEIVFWPGQHEFYYHRLFADGWNEPELQALASSQWQEIERLRREIDGLRREAERRQVDLSDERNGHEETRRALDDNCAYGLRVEQDLAVARDHLQNLEQAIAAEREEHRRETDAVSATMTRFDEELQFTRQKVSRLESRKLSHRIRRLFSKKNL